MTTVGWQEQQIMCLPTWVWTHFIHKRHGNQKSNTTYHFKWTLCGRCLLKRIFKNSFSLKSSGKTFFLTFNMRSSIISWSHYENEQISRVATIGDIPQPKILKPLTY
jgi:hypothetical protein